MGLSTLFWTLCVPTLAYAIDTSPEAMKKFMPNPTGHGFGDSGITAGEGFEQAQQMERFGIPDLNNPMTKELTDLDFELAVDGESYLAVMFYSHAMEDYEYYALHWEKAAMGMREATHVYTNANITMGRFDISEPEHAEIAEKYHSGDTPTLKMFKNGQFFTDIRCPISHHEIRQFIVSQTLPLITDLNDEKEMRKWKRRKQVNNPNLKFIAFLTKDTSEKEAQLTEVAKALRHKIQFARVNNEELFQKATKLKSTKPGDIVLLRDFNEQREITYTGALTLADFIEFLRQYNMPLLTNMADKEEYRVREFLAHPIEFRLLVFFKAESQFNKMKSDLEKLAREIRHEALVAYTIEDPDDGSNFDYNFWEVPGKDPAFLYLQIHKDRKYIYTGKDAHEIDVVRAFIKQVKEGTKEPKLKSGVPPALNNGPVRVVVTTTYENDIYGDPSKDSLVLFHRVGDRDSNWMLDHLTKFAKVWRREHRLTIASVDVNENDIMHVETPIIPSLFFVSAANKTNGILLTQQQLAIRYPDMEQLMQFVRENSQLDLVQDDKIWTRVLEEDNKLKEDIKKRNEEIAKQKAEEETQMNEKEVQSDGAVAEEVLDVQEEKAKEPTEGEEVPLEDENGSEIEFETLLGSKFKELRDKVLKEQEEKHGDATEKETKEEEFTGTAADHGVFPGSFSGVQHAQKVLQSELSSLLASTGFEIPKDFDEKFDPKALKDGITWYNSLLLFINLGLIGIFGSGVWGGIAVLVILSSLFIGLPALLRWRRKRNMKKWLTEFYTQHKRSHLNRVDEIVNAYMDMSGGFNKMKEDAIRRHVIIAESKKNK